MEQQGIRTPLRGRSVVKDVGTDTQTMHRLMYMANSISSLNQPSTTSSMPVHTQLHRLVQEMSQS